MSAGELCRERGGKEKLVGIPFPLQMYHIKEHSEGKEDIILNLFITSICKHTCDRMF